MVYFLTCKSERFTGTCPPLSTEQCSRSIMQELPGRHASTDLQDVVCVESKTFTAAEDSRKAITSSLVCSIRSRVIGSVPGRAGVDGVGSAENPDSGPSIIMHSGCPFILKRIQ